MESNRPLFANLTIILLVLLAIGGLYGGIALIGDPSGIKLGLGEAFTENPPVFNDFLIPGILLVILFGLLPLFAAISLIRFKPGKPKRVGKMHRSWQLALLTGILLIIWIIVQVILIGFQSFLQPLFGGIGILLNWLLTSAPVRVYYQDPA